MSISVQPAAQLTFPAVTFCNLCPVRRSRWNAKLNNKTPIAQTSAETTQSVTATFDERISFSETSVLPERLIRRRRACNIVYICTRWQICHKVLNFVLYL